MKRAVVAAIISMTIIILLLGGCAQETVLRPGQTGAVPAGAATGNTAAANPSTAKTMTVPAAKPVSEDDDRAVPGQWETLYCNLIEGELRGEAEIYADDVGDNQDRIAELDDQIAAASGAERSTLASTKQDVQDSLRAAQENLERIRTRLADALAKCRKLDDRKDAQICSTFSTDLSARIADANEDLQKEQAKVQFITDTRRLTRQQRKILDARQTVERLEIVRNDLLGRC